MKVWGKVFCSLIVLIGSSWQAQAGSVNDQAKEALSHGRIAVASDLLSQQVKAEPGDYQAWFLLGVSEARGKHYHQAIEAFRRVIELRDDLAEPHNNLAVIYNELGDIKAAVHELEQSLQKHPGYAIAEENIADLYVKLALQYYKKAVVKDDSAVLKQRYARLLQVRDGRGKGVVADTSSPSTLLKAAKPVAQVPDKPNAEQPMPREAAEHMAENIQAGDTVVKADAANESDAAAVLASVEAWRAAWQSQDLDAYFAAYADDYVPAGKFSSLASWKAYKKRVIGNKSYIKVDLSDVKVEMSDDKDVAHVRFNQAFRSNSYNGDDVKVLKLEKDQEGWKIVREASGT